MRLRIILVYLGLLAAVAGCGSAGGAGGQAGTEVVAAFYPLAYAAAEIGREVDVTNLTPPGAEPHDVELSARDVARVGSADVVLYLGQGFQPALEAAVEDAAGDAVDLLEGLELLPGDPHVWLDPRRYAAVATRIGDVLGEPAEARVFAERLRALDREFRRELASCRRRTIVTSHAAFGYLAERYAFEQIAVTGLSPEAEPSPGALERVVAEVRAHGATTVFFETLVSPRLAETVAREAGATTAVLNPIEGLTQQEVERGEDYFSLMRSNLAALRKALACR